MFFVKTTTTRVSSNRSLFLCSNWLCCCFSFCFLLTLGSAGSAHHHQASFGCCCCCCCCCCSRSHFSSFSLFSRGAPGPKRHRFLSLVSVSFPRSVARFPVVSFLPLCVSRLSVSPRLLAGVCVLSAVSTLETFPVFSPSHRTCHSTFSWSAFFRNSATRRALNSGLRHLLLTNRGSMACGSFAKCSWNFRAALRYIVVCCCGIVVVVVQAL